MARFDLSLSTAYQTKRIVLHSLAIISASRLPVVSELSKLWLAYLQLSPFYYTSFRYQALMFATFKSWEWPVNKASPLPRLCVFI